MWGGRPRPPSMARAMVRLKELGTPRLDHSRGYAPAVDAHWDPPFGGVGNDLSVVNDLLASNWHHRNGTTFTRKERQVDPYIRSFDCAFRFASESKHFAQDDNRVEVVRVCDTFVILRDLQAAKDLCISNQIHRSFASLRMTE